MKRQLWRILKGRFTGLSPFSLVVMASLHGDRKLRACKAREAEIEAKSEPELFISGVTQT